MKGGYETIHLCWSADFSLHAAAATQQEYNAAQRDNPHREQSGTRQRPGCVVHEGAFYFNFMKILHIGKYYPPEPGGIERFVCDLAVQQVRGGHDVTVLCHHSATGRSDTTEVRSGVRIERVRIQGHLSFAPVAPAWGSRLRRAVRDTEPDLIHLHLPNPAVAFLQFLPRSIPLILHWHSDVQGGQSLGIRIGYPVYRLFESQALRRAYRVVVTSEQYLHASPTLRPFFRKCTVVPLGLDPDRISVDAGKEPEGKPRVFAAGRLAQYKGFEYLIDAAQELPQVRVEIAGKGPCLDALHQRVQVRAVQDRVSLLGYLPDVQLHRHMAEADVFCLPSIHRSEAFGIVLMEAMLLRRPLISTAIPGSATGWVNQNGVTGLVVPPRDSRALACAMEDLLSRPEQRAAMGEAAHERFQKMFSIAAVARSIEAIYCNTLD